MNYETGKMTERDDLRTRLQASERERDNWRTRANEAEAELLQIKESVRYAETCTNQTLSQLHKEAVAERDAATQRAEAAEQALAKEHRLNIELMNGQMLGSALTRAYEAEATVAALEQQNAELKPKTWNDMIDELAQLRAQLADMTRERDAAHREKDRRVYYQQIVYDVCNRLDRATGRSVTAGTGIVCGTVESATLETQIALDALIAERDGVRAQINDALTQIVDPIGRPYFEGNTVAEKMSSIICEWDEALVKASEARADRDQARAVLLQCVEALDYLIRAAEHEFKMNGVVADLHKAMEQGKPILAAAKAELES